MAIHVALYHKTHYTYDQAVGHGPHVVRLRPAPHCRTKILSYSQKITGGEHFINWQQDPFSNWNARLVFPDKMEELRVEIELVAEMAVHNPFDFFLEESAQIFPFAYEAGLKKELAAFMELPTPTPKLLTLVDELLAKYLTAKARTIDFLVEVNQRLQHDIKYTIRLEPGVQTPEETLTKLSGSCRDTGWLLVQTLRSMGFAARFVSGYLIQLTPDVKFICRAPAGSVLTRPAVCSRAKATSRLAALPNRRAPRQSAARSTSASPRSTTK
jgi:transglutaminase-like putative cysteine protease